MAVKEQLILAPRNHQLDTLRDLAVVLAILHSLSINRSVTLLSDEENRVTSVRVTRLHYGDADAIREALAKEAPGVVMEQGLLHTTIQINGNPPVPRVYHPLGKLGRGRGRGNAEVVIPIG